MVSWLIVLYWKKKQTSKPVNQVNQQTSKPVQTKQQVGKEAKGRQMDRARVPNHGASNYGLTISPSFLW